MKRKLAIINDGMLAEGRGVEVTDKHRENENGEDLDAPLKWHGGKRYLSDWILKQMPPHVHYVEPFAGGLAVLLGKNPNGVSEVVNDLDGDLMNFWRVLKDADLFQAFSRSVEATPFSQSEFVEAALSASDDSDVDRAVKFFIRCRQSRQGLMKNFATLSKNRTRRNMNEQVASWLTSVAGLAEIHERLKRVVILNENAMTVIQREDSLNTLFYCDPPYLHETRVTTNNYAKEMSVDDHKTLLTVLSQVKGKFILSGYRSDLYDEFTARFGWRRVDREIDCKASAAKEKPSRIESLWMNYDPSQTACRTATRI